MTLKLFRLEDVSDILSGSTPKTDISEYWDGANCWATPKDLSQLESAYISDTPRKITDAGLQSCSAPILPAGSVLFSSRAPIGHVAVNTVPMSTNQGFKSFVPHKDKVCNKYLYYWLKANKHQIERLGNGATFKEVSKSVIGRVEIPLPYDAARQKPDVDEQKRIAEVLDTADALRQKRRLTLQKLDSLLQSVFLDMFGDPIENPKEWPSGNVESVVDERSDVRCGPFGTQLKIHEIAESGVPLFGIENVHNNKFKSFTKKFVTEEKAKQLRAFEIKPNDVLVTRMGTIGRACVVPSDFERGLFSYHLLRIRPNPTKCIPAFLSATICRSGTFQSQLRLLSHGAIMAGLNTSILRSVKFLVPPLSLQSEYVSFVNTTEALIKKAEALSDLSTDLFESLQQRAFKGELFGNVNEAVRK